MKFLAYVAGVFLSLGGILWGTASWAHLRQESQARLVEGLPLSVPGLPLWVTTLRYVGFIMLLLGAAGAALLVGLLLRTLVISRTRGKQLEESPLDPQNFHEAGTSKGQARKATGLEGEQIAARFLKGQGYQIVETNFRCPQGELDIVARKGEYLVFVEVRTRGGQEWGTPEESVTAAKRRRLITLAHAYLEGHPGPVPPWRIDVVAVELEPGGTTQVRLIENAVD